MLVCVYLFSDLAFSVPFALIVSKRFCCPPSLSTQVTNPILFGGGEAYHGPCDFWGHSNDDDDDGRIDGHRTQENE
jgi:hypothetical protein